MACGTERIMSIYGAISTLSVFEDREGYSFKPNMPPVSTRGLLPKQVPPLQPLLGKCIAINPCTARARSISKALVSEASSVCCGARARSEIAAAIGARVARHEGERGGESQGGKGNDGEEVGELHSARWERLCLGGGSEESGKKILTTEIILLFRKENEKRLHSRLRMDD